LYHQKIKNQIVIPQRALSNIFERVDNEQSTFNIPSKTSYFKILHLDDAVGSGATLKEIALKLKHKNIASQIV